MTEDGTSMFLAYIKEGSNAEGWVKVNSVAHVMKVNEGKCAEEGGGNDNNTLLGI